MATTTYVIGNGSNGAGANQIVSSTTGGVTTYYGYDANGNRTSRTVSVLITTGDTASGSVTLSGLGSLSEVTVGMAVIGAGIASGATVVSLVSSSSVTLSVAATATNSGASITFGNTDTYSYDDENRLIGLDYETGESGTGTYAYAYDYRTRRVARTEPGPVSTNIAFDDGVSIIEYGSAGASSPNVEYVRGHDYGGGVGGLEYSVRSGAASFNLFDSRGDVTTQTDSSGAVTFQTGYEAFGNQTVTSGSTLDRQKASTKEEDPTGLLNEGMRYRDPDTGTFLTRDPLGFKAGPNMYTYVRQNPWTHFDPEGLATEDDYKKDQQKAKTWHDQATKEAGGDKTKQKQADDTYNKWNAADQKGIDNIESTARYVKKLADQYGAKIGSEHDIAGKLDDSWQSYKDLQKYRAAGITPSGIESGKKIAEAGLIAGATIAGLGVLADSAFALRGAVYLEMKLPGLTAFLGVGAGGYYTANRDALISRWGRPGLQPGDWAMKGGPTLWNYIKSGKWQPGMGNQFAPFSSGRPFTVPASTLKLPGAPYGNPITDQGAAAMWKAALGQRIYDPNSK